MKMIDLESCKDGHLYLIGARNSDLGVFVEDEKGFVINRFKINKNFLFVEYHWDTGAPYGTALCFEDLGPAADYPWVEYHKVSGEEETEMLKYLSDCYERYDVQFKRSLRYCMKSIDSGKTAEDIVGFWAMEQKEEMKARLIEAVQKELDKSNGNHNTKADGQTGA